MFRLTINVNVIKNFVCMTVDFNLKNVFCLFLSINVKSIAVFNGSWDAFVFNPYVIYCIIIYCNRHDIHYNPLTLMMQHLLFISFLWRSHGFMVCIRLVPWNLYELNKFQLMKNQRKHIISYKLCYWNVYDWYNPKLDKQILYIVNYYIIIKLRTLY